MTPEQIKAALDEHDFVVLSARSYERFGCGVCEWRGDDPNDHRAEVIAALMSETGDWVLDYDDDAPVVKEQFGGYEGMGNCPGCSNVTWHAKRCPWLRGWRDAVALMPEVTETVEYGVRVMEGDPDFAPGDYPATFRSVKPTGVIDRHPETRRLICCTRRRYADEVSEWQEIDDDE